MEIEVGSVYKIDHSKLLTTTFSSTPFSIFSIKAVFVEEKSEEEVTLRYPSRESIEEYISEGKLRGLMQPTFDKKFILGLNFANNLLMQKIPFEVFVNQRGNQSFWALDSDHDHHYGGGMTSSCGCGGGGGMTSACGGGGGGGGVVTWAKRKRTSSVCKSRVHACGPPILPCADVIIVKKPVDDDDGDGDHEELMEEVEEEKEVRVVRRRKCNFKGVKYVEKKKRKNNNVNINVNNKRLIEFKNEDEKKFINSKHRWTVERYKVAEEFMLQVMKEKGAVPGNPILRPELRSEARKWIGDTGLLDHLLLHMSGKLAPGGKERFRRRHNPEGCMEYWIESADLVHIRKNEGIVDPFWFPPPGWKPGDNPYPDPVCAKQIKDLRSQVADIKREVENLGNQKESKSQAIVTVPAVVADAAVESSNFLVSLTPHLKEMFGNLLKKKAQVEMQLSEISTSLSAMEEEIIMLKEPTSEETEQETKEVQVAMTSVLEQDTCNKVASSVNEAEISQEQQTDDLHKQDDAEKSLIRRSGFRICKPIGTFLWPSQTQPPPPPPPFFHHRRHGGPPSPVVKRPVARRASLTLTLATTTTSTTTSFENMMSNNTASPTDTTGSNNSTITFFS